VADPPLRIFMAKKQPPPAPQSEHPAAQAFSDDEMEQAQRFGQALGGQPSAFDEDVEKALAKHYPKEFGAEKMHAAQTGGSPGLGPTEAEQALAKQQQALQQQAATTGAVAAQQAQAGQSGQPTPPPAPTGSAGVTTPYSAQAGAVGGAGEAPQGGGSQGEAPPEAPGAEQQEES
jgi:hypothetical protein